MPAPEGLEQNNWSPSQHILFDEVRRLNWQQFEALCAELFFKKYQADNCWLTHSGGDYGADVVVIKGGKAILVQCKHTGHYSYDGYRAVTEVHSAKVKYEAELGKQIDTLIFVTNAMRLGAKTRKAAKQYSVNVVDGKELSKLLDLHVIQYKDVLQRLDKKRLQV